MFPHFNCLGVHIPCLKKPSHQDEGATSHMLTHASSIGVLAEVSQQMLKAGAPYGRIFLLYPSVF